MKRLSMMLIFMASACAVFADTFDDVAMAIKGANAKEVAQYFNSTVELTVLDNEGVYSKQQAEVILKNFFTANPPRSVVINHRGSSAQGSRYAIATYECQQGRFRAYIFMKDSGSGMVIQELKFEKE